MRIGWLEIWCYRTTCKPWLWHGRYFSGRVHHITIGPVTVVVDYRSKRP